MNRYRYDKGSFTIEASMVFIVIVSAIFALLFTFLYMQQKAYLLSAASFAAQQGAELWTDSRKSIEDGKVIQGMKEDSVNYRVFDNLLFSSKAYEGHFEERTALNGKSELILKMDCGDNLPGRKAAKIGEALKNKIERTVLKPEITKFRISYANSALRGSITVEITQEVKVPLGGIKQFFDGKDTLTLNAKATAAVAEPDEYIRNIDLGIELYKKTGEQLDFDGLIDKVRSKVQK